MFETDPAETLRNTGLFLVVSTKFRFRRRRTSTCRFELYPYLQLNSVATKNDDLVQSPRVLHGAEVDCGSISGEAPFIYTSLKNFV